MPGVNLGTGFWTVVTGGPTLEFAGTATVTVFKWPVTVVLFTWLTTPVLLTRTGPSPLTRPAMLAPFAPPATLAPPMLAPFTWPATLVLLMLEPLTRPATLALTRPAMFGWMVGMRGAMLRLGERMKLCASTAVPAKHANVNAAAAGAARRAINRQFAPSWTMGPRT